MINKNYFTTLFTLLFFALFAFSCTESTDDKSKEGDEAADKKEEAPKYAKLPVDHTIWDNLTKAHVSDGYVKYAAMKKDEAKLDEYLAMLSSTPPTDEWSRDQKLAYWINAYNAFTVKLILNNSDKKLGSIKDLEKKPNIPFVNTPWDIKFFEIDGKKMDLNKIEHGTVRKDFEEPRIHFVLVCAAKSCPPLMSGAFYPEILNQQLEDRTSSFLNNPAMNKFDGNSAQVTPLLDWYKKDFKKGKNTVAGFISEHSKHQLNEDAEITFMDYDWSLNGDWK